VRHTCERLVAALLFLILASAAQAQTYMASFSGSNESPPVASAGTGSTTVTVNATANTLRVISIFSGLNSNTTASHIHCCVAPPGNAGVATTVPSFVGFPLGVTAGTMDQTYDMTQSSTWNPAFITANGGTTAGAEAALLAGLAAGQAYVNIHTVTSPGGEIRALLPAAVVVPTLPGWLLGVCALLLTAGAYVALRRRMSTPAGTPPIGL
jgi:CHRD domain